MEEWRHKRNNAEETYDKAVEELNAEGLEARPRSAEELI